MGTKLMLMDSDALCSQVRAEGVTSLLRGGKWADSTQLIREFDDVEWLRSRINVVFQAISRSTDLPKIRVFVDYGNRTDLAVKLARSPMHSGEDFDAWVQRSLKVDRYCLALNGVSAWDDELANYLQRRFIVPLVGRLGYPLRGFDAYLFAGRYDLTPFGIHTDSEPSLLLQLGPAPKEALVWSQSQYKKIAGSDAHVNEFDVQKRAPHGVRYDLVPGDMLYIPVDEPHVMMSPEFSITLGLIPNPADTKALFVEIARELADGVGPPCRDVSFLQPGTDALSLLTQLSSDSCELFSGAVEALERIKLRLESNGFLLPPPRAAPEVYVLDGAELRVPDYYPIRFTKSGEHIRLFARGHAIRMRAVPSLVRWMETLRPGSSTRLGDIRTYLGADFEEAAIERIVRTLLRLRALEALR